MSQALRKICLTLVTILTKNWFAFNYVKPVTIGVNYSDGEKCGCGGCTDGCNGCGNC